MKNKRYSEFFTFVHFGIKDTKSQIKEFISEQLEYNSEAQVTEDESGNSELLKYDIESDTIDWYFSDENGNEVKKENSITNGDGEYVENMYRVYFSRVIISDYQGDDYYLEDWMEQNDYYTTEKREKELIKEEMLNEIRIRIGCPEDDEGTEYERDVIEEIEKLLLVERWLFQEAKEPVRSEALKWLSKFGYKEDE